MERSLLPKVADEYMTDVRGDETTFEDENAQCKLREIALEIQSE
jgi:hypothetical protein